MYGAGRPKWGWHRLADSYAKQIVREAQLSSADLVLDIGAGDGSLTRPLAHTGARVIAIELHERRVERLREEFATNPRVKVVRADARDLWLPHKPFHVVANPPFSITSSLLYQLLARHSRLVSARLVFQRSVVRKHVEINRWNTAFELKLNQNLPRSAFVPRPQVDVAVLEIRRVKRVYE